MLIRPGPRDSALLFMHAALWLVILGQTNIIDFTWLNTKRWLELDYRRYSALTPASLSTHTHTNTGAQPPSPNSPVVLIRLCHQSQVDPTHLSSGSSRPVPVRIFLLFSLICPRLDLPIGTTLLSWAVASFSSVPFNVFPCSTAPLSCSSPLSFWSFIYNSY